MQRGGVSLAIFQILQGRFHHVVTWSLSIGDFGGHYGTAHLVVVFNFFSRCLCGASAGDLGAVLVT